MGFDRRAFSLTVPSPAATITQTANLRSTYVRVIGIKVLSTGTDTSEILKLTDADSRVFYLDSAAIDYDTAALTRYLASDDVETGLGMITYDSVGAAIPATQTGPMPVVKSPITIEVSGGGTAGDVIDVTFDYEYGCFAATAFTLPTASGNTSTKTVSLRSKYAQLLGFKALSVGTSTTTILGIKDADNRTVYLDAAAKDYDTAALDKVIVMDPTVTGLTGLPWTWTGVAIQAGEGLVHSPLVRSPLTITATEQDGNDEVITGTLYYKTG